MFDKLFAESGLSLDRLRALLAVGAAGSMVKAADGDPVRQSQYSRQIKELEDFFRVKLIERHGKGTRLTSTGKELARISRFFMLGLANFQRGCLAEEQTFRIGASATFAQCFLMSALSFRPQTTGLHVIEVAGDEEIERRLHDLTMDFGIVGSAELSRPLQTRFLWGWSLNLWVPRALGLGQKRAAQAFKEHRLPLVLAKNELSGWAALAAAETKPQLVCDSFVDARMAGGQRAMLLPDFLSPGDCKAHIRINIERGSAPAFGYYLAWNPRLLRLNPHAAEKRDQLFVALRQK
jgi:DNA-binding transcriptional LysR family regulator